MGPRPSRGGRDLGALNQRTSSSSSPSARGSPRSASAWKPSMSELGNGHGWDAT